MTHSNDMKLIMENWRRNVLNEANEFDNVTVREFINKFAKYSAASRSFLQGFGDLVGKLDTNVDDSKKKKALKIGARAVKNYALGSALEWLGGLVGAAVGGVAAGAITAGGGAAPGAVIGAGLGKEGVKAAKALLQSFWSEGVTSSSSELKKMFLSMQVKDGSTNDPLILAFDLEDGYNALLRGGSKGAETDFFKKMLVEFLGQISQMLEAINNKEKQLSSQIQTGAIPNVEAFRNKKLSEIFPNLKTSDMMAQKVLSLGGKYEVKPAGQGGPSGI